MVPRQLTRRSRPRILFLLLTLLITTSATHIQAEDLRETTSLKWIPANTAFYSASLRTREQFEALMNSNAVARLKQLPLVQLGIFQLRTMWNDPDNEELQEFKTHLEKPENQQLIQMLIDAVSTEIFIYGDNSYADQFAMLSRINTAVRQAQFSNISSPEETPRAILENVLDVMIENADTLAIPDTVIGFRLSDRQPALDQLDRLEKLAQEALQEMPELKERIQREQITGGQFLTANLDGSLIPWDQVPLDEEEIPREQAEQLIEIVKKMTLTISVGVRDDYLLISIGDNNQHLERFGKGKLLIDRAEFAPLRKYSDERLTDISYVSEEFIKRAGAVEQQIDDLVGMAESMLPQAPLSEEVQKELIADIKLFGEDVKQYVPEPGAVMTFAFLNARGYEGYSYNWGEHRTVDASRKLTILDHLGGTPILFLAGRGKYVPEDYDILVKWLKRACYHFDRIVPEQMDADEREAYQQVRDRSIPLLKRLDKTNREQLLPAFADGQAALVIDAKLDSQQLELPIPPAEEPLPVPEIALVYGISDAESLKQAAAEYLEVTREMIEIVRQAAPEGEVPPFEIPDPETEDLPGGTMYFFPLPSQWGVGTHIAPNAGVSQDFLVLSAAPSTTQRLLQENPLTLDGPLANIDRPLASAAYCNWAAFLDALDPWIDYGIAQSQGGEEPLDVSVQLIKDQVKFGLKFLKCFQGGSSVRYREGDAMVSHFEMRFQDLEEE